MPASETHPSDFAARERALDVTHSFLVQAPAGSGKTELLIQRFLMLLAHVDRPERIVAMTFTRKAAGEMRERIVEALRDAAAGCPVDAPHARRTRELALAALARDRFLGWQLATHPARLQVQTIDALCLGLARQAPLATTLGAAPRVEERAGGLYAEAARVALASAAATDPAWPQLLAHLDNDADRAIGLLQEMLGKRDQWLREILPEDARHFREELEEVLAAEILGELVTLRAAFRVEAAAALIPLERYAAGNLAVQPETLALAQSLTLAADAGGLPPATIDSLPDWRALADWLLKSNAPAFLKAVNAKKGFSAKGRGPGAALRDARNAEMRRLLEDLAAQAGLAAALDVARRLPPPRYADGAWAIVAALLDVLPRVAGELILVFRSRGVVDFTQALLAALDALGTSDAPTDLLLKLDLSLQHLLIDEFQDTSFTQLELLRRLTAGWQPGDGRTLFAVGDPMQSIYKFRQAEVRLFVEAQQRQCIGEIPVECLVLRSNFRSQASLVDWVNAVFPGVLGAQSDPWRSVVAFASASPVHPREAGPPVTVDLAPDSKDEAAIVVQHIRDALAGGAGDVAVLVRARRHLDALLPALRVAAIPFAAVDLDLLAERQAVLDLISLTHALAQPADRLAWLSVLRAPWCGLTLHDLFAVASAADTHGAASIADLLARAEAIAGLSDDGQARFVSTSATLRPALEARGRAALSARVRGAWLALGGPACLEEAIDVVAAERFFALLAENEHGGDVADWAELVAALGELRAESAQVSTADAAPRVKVMTLHKAKGLEFDTVIIPGMASVPPRGNPELLRWRRRPQGLLLAPMKASGGDDDPIYRYLDRLKADEDDAELGRLLYVGCTRAKRRLHLVGVLPARTDHEGNRRWQLPSHVSALGRLWAALSDTIPKPAAVGAGETNHGMAPVLLARLPLDWTPSLPEAGLPSPAPDKVVREAGAPVFDWARETARHVGTVAHRVLAQIAREGLDAWPVDRIAALAPRLRAELAGAGVDAAGLPGAVAQVSAALSGVLTDSRGRWLFEPLRADSHSEYALTGLRDGALAHIVLDRTFVDATGVRWIVDFKLSRHEGGNVDAFLDSERERYREQLEDYAQVMRGMDQRAIRLGLYFPLLRGWREWDAPR
jgi:ATP-dependent helicase/nuclease subunit A